MTQRFETRSGPSSGTVSAAEDSGRSERIVAAVVEFGAAADFGLSNQCTEAVVAGH